VGHGTLALFQGDAATAVTLQQWFVEIYLRGVRLAVIAMLQEIHRGLFTIEFEQAHIIGLYSLRLAAVTEIDLDTSRQIRTGLPHAGIGTRLSKRLLEDSYEFPATQRLNQRRGRIGKRQRQGVQQGGATGIECGID